MSIILPGIKVATILISFANVFTLCHGGATLATAENKCKEELFLKPYVTLRKSNVGPVYATLETQGLMDLQEAAPAYICVNGAVILYHQVRVDKEKAPGAPKNGTVAHLVPVKPGETFRYSNGTVQIFSHKCWYVNRLSKTKAPEMKVTGIFLLTNKGPYNPTGPPLKLMLNRKGLGYKVGAGEDTIKDASFLTVGKGRFCLAVKGGSRVEITSKAESDSQLCHWSKPSESDKGYRKLFKRRYSIQDYTACSTDPTTSNDTEKVPPVTEEKVSPFAMIRKNGKESDLQKGKNQTQGHQETPISSEEVDIKDEGPPIKYSIELEDCVSPPDVKFNKDDPLCQLYNNPDSVPCEKLSSALELDAGEKEGGIKKRADATSPAASGAKLEDDERLKWKQDVLTLVASIFTKICVPLRKSSVYQLMRLIGSYLAKAHASNPQEFEGRVSYPSPGWDIMMSSLQRCDRFKNTQPFEWEWPKQKLASQKRVKREDPLEPRLKSLVFDQLLPVPENEDEDDDSIPLIQRSSPSFNLEPVENDPSRPVLLQGSIPRWRRQSELDKIPLPSILEYAPFATAAERVATHAKFLFHPKPDQIRIKNKATKQIFYYTDVAQSQFDLSPVVDSFWKVLTTVLGYCLGNPVSRANMVYPLALVNFDQYFFDLLKDVWTRENSTDLEEDLIVGEFQDPDRSQWLDTCLETAFIVTDSLRLRTARPLFLPKEAADDAKFKSSANNFVERPGDIPGGSVKYFGPRKM